MTTYKKGSANNSITEIDNQEILLNELNMKITYRLFKAGGLYLISVGTNTENVTVLADTDKDEAQRLFGLFIRGEVTPCTANDIARDFMMNKIR